MEYYLISLILTIFIFSIIQLYEYNKNKREIDENINNYYVEPYSLFNMNNILLFIILYIVLTIGAYYLNISKWKFPEFNKTLGGNVSDIKEDIDPKILSKINDNFNVGFEPFTSDIDADDVSSLSSLSSSA